MTMRPVSVAGFSLFEIVAVMAITAILLGMTWVLGIQTLRFYESERTHETIRRELLIARSDTMNGTRDATFGLAFFPHQIVRFQGSTYASRNAAFDVVSNFTVDATLSGTSEVSFTATDGAPNHVAVITIVSSVTTTVVSVNAAGMIQVQ